MTAFIDRLRELTDAIEENRARKRTLPTLVLLFTAIDSLGALESGRATRSTFTGWVGEFLLGADETEWSALDLYAARCAVLHTQTADSALAAKGEAKRFLYAWGSADVTRLKLATTRIPGHWACVHLDDLTSRFHRAVTRVLDLMEVGDDRSKRLLNGAARWYDNISVEAVDRANA